MPYTYRLHPKADEEYTEAYAWYEDKQEGLGEKFISAVRQKIESIAANPEVYGHKAKKAFREAPLDNFPYVIVYKLYKREKAIFIASVHHFKKNPKTKYRR